MTFPSSSAAEPRREGEWLLLTLVVLFLSTVLLIRWITSSRRRHVACGRLPPGDEGLPLLGETLRLISAYKSEDPEAFMDERVARHGGRVFTSHVFGERTVFSCDPEVNRLVLQNEGKLLECSYPSSITTLLGRHALVLSKGPYHRRMHSLTLSSFSTHTALKERHLPHIDRLVRLHLHSWADGQVLHLLDHAKKITFDLAVKQLLSFEPGEWTEGLRREYQYLIDGFFSLPIPFFSFTTYGRAVQARRKVAEALKLVFRQRRLSMMEEKQQQQQQQQQEEEEEGRRPKRREAADMLGTLLAEGVRDEEQVVDYLLALLVAGYETTSTTMTLAVKFLSESPEALATLTEEQNSIRTKREEERSGHHSCLLDLQWADYKNSMPFTHCVINETLRISNIISGVFRRAIADIHVGGYTIPMGCKVFASFRAVHMDSEYYKDARTFNPWRWQQQQPFQQQHNMAGGSELNVFMPFGGGARLCPGHELARVELAVFLHHLVTTFSWEAVGEDRLVFFPTTRTLKGYPIRVHHLRCSTA